jgi:hypothetical protein
MSLHEPSPSMATASMPKPPYSKSQSQSQSQSHLQPHSQWQSQRSASAQKYSLPPIPNHNSHPRSASHPTSPGNTRQDEKDFVAHYEERQQIVSPERIEHDSANKKLGFSSRKLRVADFELMKTLGTGISTPSNRESNDEAEVFHRDFCTGLASPSGKSKE